MLSSRLSRLWLIGVLAIACLGLPSAGAAAPSPTGRTPKLLWTPARQDVWLQMKSDFDQGANTLGAKWYKLIKDAAEAGNRYGDTGLWATLMFQTTGDAKYAALAWTKIQGFLNRTDLNGNYGREYSAEQVMLYDWLYPGLNATQRSQWLAHLNEMFRQLTTNPSSPNMPVLGSDSDQMTGTYFGLAFLYLATNDHNPSAAQFWNAPYVGGLTSTGNDRTTMRNAVRNYVEVLGRGGEWMESSEYNLGTVRLLMMGVEGVKTATGQEYFPEAREFLKAAALRPLNFATNNLANWFEWGDVEEPRKFQGHLYLWVTSVGMLAGLNQGEANGPALQDHVLDLVEKFGPTGYNSAEPWARIFLFFNPYAPRGDRTSVPTSWYSPGQGFLFMRDGWDDSASIFMAHMRPKQDGVHHEVQVFGDFQIYRKGAWGMTHPMSYAGPSLYGEGANAMTLATFSTALEARITVAEEVDPNKTFAYVAGTTGGQIYNFSYYDPPPTFMHEWTRSLVYLPSTNKTQDTVVIFDRVHATNPQAEPKFNRYRAATQTAIQNAPGIKQWFFHMPVEPTLTPDAVTWRTDGGAYATLQNVSGLSLRRDVENQAVIWATNTKVRESERKWQVRLIPTEDRPWNTLLQVLTLSDSPSAGSNVSVRSQNGEAEGVVVRRPSHKDMVLMFGATQGALLPAPTVISGTKYSAANFEETLTNSRKIRTGYSMQFTAQSSATDVLIFDLDKTLTWSAVVDGQSRSLTLSTDGGIARIAINGASSHSIQLAPTGNAARPIAPRNPRLVSQ
jgi:hypothetical protein